jgi:hypothetical protein
MTMAKTQRAITIEAHRQILIRSRRKAFIAWCEACGTETLMLATEAAVLCGATQREIFRQIEGGELHFIETIDGPLFLCSNSLQLPQKS